MTETYRQAAEDDGRCEAEAVSQGIFLNFFFYQAPLQPTFWYPLGSSETSNYSNTPVGTAVCRSSPPLILGSQQAWQNPPKRAGMLDMGFHLWSVSQFLLYFKCRQQLCICDTVSTCVFSDLTLLLDQSFPLTQKRAGLKIWFEDKSWVSNFDSWAF